MIGVGGMSFKVLARFGAGRSGDDSDSSLIAKFLDERTVETSLVQIPGQCFSFMLDRVFTPNETNKDVHGVCTMPAVQQLMAGQNAAVLLYGHGGSGKLDTAFGTKSMAGLLSMTIEAIFEMGLPSVTLSAVDVFKEALRDLLAKPSAATGPALRLRDSNTNTTIEGTTEVVLHGPGEEGALIPSLSNSRGHAVVTLRTPQGGKIFIVKLADSDAGAHGRGASAEGLEARKWSKRSFAALGSCLKAVADRVRIVPVREGLLTRLLRDALSAQANVTLIGHCSTSDALHEESVNTLRFIHQLCLIRPPRARAVPISMQQQQQRTAALEWGETPAEPSHREGAGRAPPAPERPAARATDALRGGSPHRSTSARNADATPTNRLRGGPDFARGSAGGGAARAQEELALAWEYAFNLENALVWAVEEQRLAGAFDPTQLAALVVASTREFAAPRTIASAADRAAELDALSREELLRLPGAEGILPNFRRAGSPGLLQEVLSRSGVVARLREQRGLLDQQALGSPTAGLGTPAEIAAEPAAPASAGEAAYEPPRVVTEDAKFLHLDSRILALEQGTSDAAGVESEESAIESLRKDIEDSLDHIDDELFANLVSRVSYLKMRREWDREELSTPSASLPSRPGILDAVLPPSTQQSRKDSLLQELQFLKRKSAAERASKGAQAEVPLQSRPPRESKGVRWARKEEVKEFEAVTPDERTEDDGSDDDGADQLCDMAEWSSASQEEISAGRLLDMLRASLPTHEKRHQSQVFGRCFTGEALVDWLVEAIDAENVLYVTKVWSCVIPALPPGGRVSRDQACIIAQGLMNAQVFAHLGSAADFSDDGTLYRFIEGEEVALVLNRQILWDRSARSACDVSLDLLRQAIALAHASGARDFDAVQEFQHKTCELQMVNLIQLPVDELRCFFINIFNVLVLHARITLKAPVSDSHVVPRCSFFRNTSYQVGKYFYSLDDICRGILRAKKCLFLECDPRVHFALSYGTAATPPVRLFTPQNLERELEGAARKFCSEHVRVDMVKSEVTLPLIFDWYRKDFSQSPVGLITWVAPRLPSETAQNLSLLSQRREIKIIFE